eukprot:5618976-Prymnesium_polylepis.3
MARAHDPVDSESTKERVDRLRAVRLRGVRGSWLAVGKDSHVPCRHSAQRAGQTRSYRQSSTHSALPRGERWKTIEKRVQRRLAELLGVAGCALLGLPRYRRLRLVLAVSRDTLVRAGRVRQQALAGVEAVDLRPERNHEVVQVLAHEAGAHCRISAKLALARRVVVWQG